MSKLLTGGSGKLGTELQKLDSLIYAPSSDELNILTPREFVGIDVIIHAAAFTDLKKAEEDPTDCYLVNVEGTRRISNAYKYVPFVFISTEYAWNPINNYGHTKYLAEEIVRQRKGPYMILRTLFKPRPFPHKKAFTDQYTRGDYCDTIAMLILEKVNRWDKKTVKRKPYDIEYIGTGRKTMYDLAKRTNSKVGKCKIADFKDYPIPDDYC